MKELLKELGFEHLPTLSEFVKERGSKIVDGGATFHENAQLILEKINTYNDFITQPLTKEMFVPCDEEGDVLEEPELFPEWSKYHNADSVNDNQSWGNKVFDLCKQYQQALGRVLFVNKLKNQTIFFDEVDYYLSSRNGKIWMNEKTTIEQAINNGVKLYLR